jgi:hypothetical protein
MLVISLNTVDHVIIIDGVSWLIGVEVVMGTVFGVVVAELV